MLESVIRRPVFVAVASFLKPEDFAAAQVDPMKVFSPDRPGDIALSDWAKKQPPLANFLLMDTPDKFVNFVNYVNDVELPRRSNILSANYGKSKMHDLSDSEITDIPNYEKIFPLPEIILFVDEVNSIFDIYGQKGDNDVAKAMKLVNRFVSVSRNRLVRVFIAAQKMTIEILGSQRDQFVWFLYGATKREQVYIQDDVPIQAPKAIGTFTYVNSSASGDINSLAYASGYKSSVMEFGVEMAQAEKRLSRLHREEMLKLKTSCISEASAEIMEEIFYGQAGIFETDELEWPLEEQPAFGAVNRNITISKDEFKV